MQPCYIFIGEPQHFRLLIYHIDWNYRSFFAQALLDHPSNPLTSPYALSFQTALRCASIIIKGAAHHFERCEAIAVRCWFLMGHVFSAAVRYLHIVLASSQC